MDQVKLAKMFGVSEIFCFSELSSVHQKEASLIVSRISAGTANKRKDYIYGFNKSGKLSLIPCYQKIIKGLIK